MFLVTVGANENGWYVACSVCICFICILQVNNLLVFFVGHVLVFCLGTSVSCWMFFCHPINLSFKIIRSFNRYVHINENALSLLTYITMLRF